MNLIILSSITGVILALRGKETSDSEFLVEDILEAGPPPQIERPAILGPTNNLIFAFMYFSMCNFCLFILIFCSI